MQPVVPRVHTLPVQVVLLGRLVQHQLPVTQERLATRQVLALAVAAVVRLSRLQQLVVLVVLVVLAAVAVVAVVSA